MQCIKTRNVSKFINWIEMLENDLAEEIGKFKREKPNIFQNSQNNNSFTNIAIELERIINSQVSNISNVLNSQFDEANMTKVLSDHKTLFENLENLNEQFEVNYGIKDLDNLKIIYEFYSNKFEEANLEILEKINNNFQLYNLNNDN